jgi:hypothetical protein
MELKGAYSSGTSYNVGDVVTFNGAVYHLQKPADAGTEPVNTLHWGRLDQELAEAVRLIMDAITIAEAGALDGKVANNLTTTASGKVLDARQGKALKTLVDAAQKAVDDLNPDAKTIRLASSTASSEKIFDITVDDDGELTATEYTPAT